MLSKQAEIDVKNLLLKSGPLWLGLFDGAPANDGTGANEITYTGYERQPIEFGGTMTEAPAGNTNKIEIPRPPENFAARSITHCGIWNAKTGGQLRLFGVLRRKGVPSPYPLGYEATFAIGANGVQFDLVNIADLTGCGG